jgi:hypothetical protein
MSLIGALQFNKFAHLSAQHFGFLGSKVDGRIPYQNFFLPFMLTQDRLGNFNTLLMTSLSG